MAEKINLDMELTDLDFPSKYFIEDEFIDTLLLVEPDTKEKESMDMHKSNACSICLEDLNRCPFITELTCNHKFHSSCLDTWISQHNNNTCPICRLPLRQLIKPIILLSFIEIGHGYRHRNQCRAASQSMQICMKCKLNMFNLNVYNA
uniref:RING-type E3 ubiquitin transferase n=1 Tax=Strigamia maritima TaxID=126957 RepID=T1IKT5_STRMM